MESPSSPPQTQSFGSFFENGFVRNGSIIVFGGVFLVTVFFVMKQSDTLNPLHRGGLSSSLSAQIEQKVTPAKKELGQTLSDDFPKNIPINKSDPFLFRNYVLDYGAEKEITVMFFASGTVEETTKTYLTFFKQDGWKSSAVQSNSLESSLYASKNTMTLDVSVNNTNGEKTKSQVVLTLHIKK